LNLRGDTIPSDSEIIITYDTVPINPSDVDNLNRLTDIGDAKNLHQTEKVNNRSV